MWPIASDGIVWSVGLSVMIMDTAKAAEPIVMSFGMLVQLSPGTMY